MTIDAGNSLRMIEAIVLTKNEPQGVVSTDVEAKVHGYKQRLFLCPEKQVQTTGAGVDDFRPKEFMAKSQFVRSINGGKNCSSESKNMEKQSKWLALSGEIYYNKKLYNVVGSRFMQGFAGLRNVAEVLITSFVYLTIPHIANSKGIIVAP